MTPAVLMKHIHKVKNTINNAQSPSTAHAYAVAIFVFTNNTAYNALCIAPVSAETFTKYHLCDYDTDKQERFWEFFNYYEEQLWGFPDMDNAIMRCIDVIEHLFDRYDYDQMNADYYKVSRISVCNR